MAARKTSSRRRPARAQPVLPGTVKLEAVRARIDDVDEQIQRLLNERAKLAQAVGISKTRDGRTVDFYRPEREAQVLRRVR
jgi:chorismate mutase/prephenate dehydratase